MVATTKLCSNNCGYNDSNDVFRLLGGSNFGAISAAPTVIRVGARASVMGRLGNVGISTGIALGYNTETLERRCNRILFYSCKLSNPTMVRLSHRITHDGGSVCLSLSVVPRVSLSRLGGGLRGHMGGVGVHALSRFFAKLLRGHINRMVLGVYNYRLSSATRDLGGSGVSLVTGAVGSFSFGTLSAANFMGSRIATNKVSASRFVGAAVRDGKCGKFCTINRVLSVSNSYNNFGLR